MIINKKRFSQTNIDKKKDSRKKEKTHTYDHEHSHK